MTRKKLTDKDLQNVIDNLSEVSEDEFSERDSLNDPAYMPEFEHEDENRENLEGNIEEESVEMNNKQEEIEKELFTMDVEPKKVTASQKPMKQTSYSESKMTSFKVEFENIDWMRLYEMTWHIKFFLPHFRITKGIKVSSKRKMEMYKSAIRDDYYKNYCRLLKQIVQRAKKMHNEKYISNSNRQRASLSGNAVNP
ncbi:hypothetical protein HHI36_017539 [Cryptolaemus montrouzieri]|uniref:Uncharacterized protein n=1 Tax=Cryptolaemus montrouzieri TaxID=559131 RepID=A0ABD2NNL7_9CUCU